MKIYGYFMGAHTDIQRCINRLVQYWSQQHCIGNKTFSAFSRAQTMLFTRLILHQLKILRHFNQASLQVVAYSIFESNSCTWCLS